MKKFKFHTSCVGFNDDLDILLDMINNSKEITWRTFLKHTDISEIRELFPHYDWHGVGLHIKDDFGVSFYKSKFKNKPCYYLCWSAIEFIFI